MRRRGFTLLETVIALAIGIIVIGAAVTANRVVQRNAQAAELRVTQESIANETISLMELTLNTQRQGAQPLSLAFDGIGTNAPVRTAPYRFRQSDPLGAADPVVIRWCTPTDASCTGIISTAGPATGSYSMATALSANGAEVLAVRKGAPVLGQPQTYDFTYLPTTGSVLATTLFADNSTHQADWDFYRRQVTITSQTTQYPSYKVVVTVWPMLAGSNRTSEAISRTITLTDY